MIRLLLPLVLLISFTSCLDKNDPNTFLAGTWKLRSIESAWTGNVSEGSDMFYTQTYRFNYDGTFVKTQNSEDGNFEATGTYTTTPPQELSSADVRFYLDLVYSDGAPIAGDCYGLDQEHLVVKNNKRIRNTWGECDCSILTYEKK